MQSLTPPQVAKLWRVSPDKVLTWIRSGELRAFNVATKLGARPAYRIEPEALDEFKARRNPKPQPKQKRSRKPSAGVIEFF
jgi:excisionase family DNA binding protein